METSSVSSKNQITIPSKVRHAMNLRKGDRLGFEVAANGVYILRKIPLQKSDGAATAYLGSPRTPLKSSAIKNAIKMGALASYRNRQK